MLELVLLQDCLNHPVNYLHSESLLLFLLLFNHFEYLLMVNFHSFFLIILFSCNNGAFKLSFLRVLFLEHLKLLVLCDAILLFLGQVDAVLQLRKLVLPRDGIVEHSPGRWILIIVFVFQVIVQRPEFGLDRKHFSEFICLWTDFTFASWSEPRLDSVKDG